MIEDSINVWVLDTLEKHKDETWRISSWWYDDLEEALDEIAVGMREKDMLPFALTFIYPDGRFIQYDQFGIFGLAFDCEITGTCMDHHSPKCVCKEAA